MCADRTPWMAGIILCQSTSKPLQNLFLTALLVSRVWGLIDLTLIMSCDRRRHGDGNQSEKHGKNGGN